MIDKFVKSMHTFSNEEYDKQENYCQKEKLQYLLVTYKLILRRNNNQMQLILMATKIQMKFSPANSAS